LTKFYFYDIIIIENKKEKNKNISKKGLTNLKSHGIIKKKEERRNNMAVSRKVEREILRMEYLQKVIESFEQIGDEVLRVKSNEIAIPVVGCEDNEDFIVITVKVPTGANKGTEPYDGYSEAESYEMKLKEKELKAKKKAEEKEKKMKRDKERREKAKEIAKKGK